MQYHKTRQRSGFAISMTLGVGLWLLGGTAIAMDCSVREKGATGTGLGLDTAAIQAAINDCPKGGRVVFAPGTYLTGTIVLKSNLELHLEAGATIKGALDQRLYTRDGLIYAKNTRNIAITGAGTIDGNGPFWWAQALLGRWRPQRMIKIVNSKNVTIQGIHLVLSPRWTLHLLACDGVLIDGVTIDNITKDGLSYTQTDGIDLEASRNVEVKHCSIEAGDDAIAVKNDADAWPLASYNIDIHHCQIGGWANGFKIGTNAKYDISHVTFRDSVIRAVKGAIDIPLGTRNIAGVAIIADNTANVHDITVTNIHMQQVQAPFFIRRQRRANAAGVSDPGRLYNITLQDIHVDDATLTSSIMGVATDTGRIYPIESVTLRNITVVSSQGGFRFQRFRQVPERDLKYPDAIYFGKFPAYGLYARHVVGPLIYAAEEVSGQTTVSFQSRVWWEGRPDIVYDDVHCVDDAGLVEDTWVFDRTGGSTTCP